MPTFEAGTVVRVPFPYMDKATRQHRPALVISDGAVGEDGALIWVVMITSAENRPWPGDVSFGAGYRKAGLPAPSVVRPCKIATIAARHAEPLGAVSKAMLRKVHAEVQRLLAAQREA